MKKAPLFFNYLMLFIPLTYFAIMLLRWLAIYYLYRLPDEYWSGIPTTMGVATVLIVVVIAVVSSISKKFDNAIYKIQKGENLSDEEVTDALRVYKKVNYVTIIAYVFGFLVGQIVVLIIEVSTGVRENHMPRLVYSVIQAILVGFTAGGSVIFYLNEILAGYRAKLEVCSLKNLQKEKSINVTTEIVIIAVITILFMAVNIGGVGFEIINRQDVNPISDALKVFLKEIFLVGIVSAIPGLSCLYVVIHGFNKRINLTGKLVENMALEGDLTSRLNITILDDFGDLIGSINSFMDSLSDMVSKLKDETDVVSNSANVLAEVSDSAYASLTCMNNALTKIDTEGKAQNNLISQADKEISELSSEIKVIENHMLNQSSALQESSASIAEMVANINSVADVAKKADSVSNILASTSSKGTEALKEAVVAVTEIQSASEEVQSIVHVIQKISSQTNLLSMNAAIEAAHAGEAGRGFAIVADEVRSLASSSAKSAKDIQVRINDMVQKINVGAQLMNEATVAFHSIVENVEENSQLVQQISLAMTEQKTGADETLSATNDVVKAISAIKILTEKQSCATKNVLEVMKSIVSSTEKVLGAIDEGEDNSLKLKDSIMKVAETVDNNTNAVVDMKSCIDTFHV